MQSNTYSIAVQAIRQHVDAEQARLDAAAAKARADHIADLRAKAIEGVPVDSPAYPIACLLSQTVNVSGRESDGYPVVSWPDSTRQVVVAAVKAGILREDYGVNVGNLLLKGVNDGRMYAEINATTADRDAWNAATRYRASQTVQTL